MRQLQQSRIATRLLAMVAVTALSLCALCALVALQVRDGMLEERREGTRAVVETALGVVASYGAQEEAGTLSRTQAQGQAALAIKGLRYSGE